LESGHCALIYYRILQLLAIYQQTFTNVSVYLINKSNAHGQTFSEFTFLVEVFKVDLSSLSVDLQYQSIQLLYHSSMKWLGNFQVENNNQLEFSKSSHFLS
jgi:hypothetical protein